MKNQEIKDSGKPMFQTLKFSLSQFEYLKQNKKNIATFQKALIKCKNLQKKASFISFENN